MEILKYNKISFWIEKINISLRPLISFENISNNQWFIENHI